MNKKAQQTKRQVRIRKKIRGTSSHPRLTVYRSNKHIYAQIIDDAKKVTLVSMHEKHAGGKETGKIEKAKEVGKELAKQAIAKKIKEVVFDKGSYAYHGRVKALADGAREGGLTF